MARTPAPPLAAVVSFIDSINRTDLESRAGLIHEQHRLENLDEEPLIGREANISAWRGYFEAFPNYVIYPCYMASTDGRVAILGTTTGSHLDLPDEVESQLGVIWQAEVVDGRLTRWAVLDDDERTRTESGIPAAFSI